MLLSLVLALAVSTACAPHQTILSDQPKKLNGVPGIPGIDASFDYVVVGGGTAGITVAARLAEKNFCVALVEAGEYYEDRSLASVPGADSLIIGASPSVHSDIDWGFVARDVPGANHRDIHYARGKCLGGSCGYSFV